MKPISKSKKDNWIINWFLHNITYEEASVFEDKMWDVFVNAGFTDYCGGMYPEKEDSKWEEIIRKEERIKTAKHLENSFSKRRKQDFLRIKKELEKKLVPSTKGTKVICMRSTEWQQFWKRRLTDD